MTKEEIINLIHEHLINYSIVMTGRIKCKNYNEAFACLEVCEAYLTELQYIQEQEKLKNASIKQ